jgi:hypothetical protein
MGTSSNIAMLSIGFKISEKQQAIATLRAGRPREKQQFFIQVRQTTVIGMWLGFQGRGRKFCKRLGPPAM